MSLRTVRNRIHGLIRVPDNWRNASGRRHEQSETLQQVGERVRAVCDHLHHMAVDVQVLAQRYDSLATSFSEIQDREPAPIPVAPTTNPPKEVHTFYGQFTPPVDQFIFERYFPHTGIQGTFIECGAFDGQLECSCKFFEETMGWQGYNLEPSPHIFANLKVNRPSASNHQVALSNRIGTDKFTVVSHPQLGLNYGNGSLRHTDSHEQLLVDGGCTFSEVEVELITWKAFIEREHITQVDLFVLDVEGHELEVIEGMHGSSVLPDVICVEVGHIPLAQVRQRLATLGYVYDISSHVNAFFVQHNKLSLFSFRQACSEL